MRKLLFSVAFVATNFAFGQITLEHSFDNNKNVQQYSGEETIYIATANSNSNNKIEVYNADFSLRKIISVPLPSDYLTFSIDGSTNFSVSKDIFNTDTKYEFLIYVTTQNGAKLILINEDGQLIKDFHPNPSTTHFFSGYSVLFYDQTNKINKYIIENRNEAWEMQFDVYSLPTSNLNIKESQSKNKLHAYPIPTSKLLNVTNPKNGFKSLEIFDISGRVVVSKNFSMADEKITIDVDSLPNGLYIYRIGDLSSKFIKN